MVHGCIKGVLGFAGDYAGQILEEEYEILMVGCLKKLW